MRCAHGLAGLFATIALLAASRAAATDGHPNIWNYDGVSNGGSPRGGLLVDAQGNLYGTTSIGGTALRGTVVEIVPAPDGMSPGTETTLYSFTGGADGSLPSGALAGDAAGNLYGVAAMDGANQGGVVFELSPPANGATAWTQTTLWSFGAGQDGNTPVGDLLVGAGGVVYGTTNWGGSGGHGVVFALTPPGVGQTAWSETVLWNFSGGADGSEPIAGLIQGSGGALYGTTKAGGSGASGTVFKLTPPAGGASTWSLQTLWAFTGGTDGAQPTSTLTSGPDGVLYGTTSFGGTLAVTCAQARFSYYGESQSQNAPALGAAYVPAGGNECGTVFALSPQKVESSAEKRNTDSWTLSTIYSFGGTPDGANPTAGLLLLSDGSLAGMTTQYGQRFYGTAFRLFPPKAGGDPWTQALLASFNGKPLGYYGRGGLVLGTANQLYGNMTAGGDTWTHLKTDGFGVLFSVDPTANRNKIR